MKVDMGRAMERVENQPAPKYSKPEVSARDAYYQSAFESTTTEDDFVKIDYTAKQELSRTSIEELTKQVGLFEKPPGFFGKLLNKPRNPNEVLSDIQSQIKDYETVKNDQKVTEHVNKLKTLEYRLKDVAVNVAVEKANSLLKSLENRKMTTKTLNFLLMHQKEQTFFQTIQTRHGKR